jgi:hypothetical protein
LLEQETIKGNVGCCVGGSARLVAVASGYERKERQIVLMVRKVAVDGDWESSVIEEAI